MSNEHFVWDSYSDQPHIIKDKKFKKTVRRKNIFAYFKLVAINLFIYPLTVLIASILKKRDIDTSKFFGMSVNLDKGEEQVELIKELGCKNILIRLPLNDVENLQDYVNFAKKFDFCNITINILQNREHIENYELLNRSLIKIFKAFRTISIDFQIGNAINRLKWGFYSVDEYLRFYEIAYKLKQEQFNQINLIGPSVIDFEYHQAIRALYSTYNIYFDKIGALLYVDRRGAPENTQLISYDTTKKIDLLYSIAKFCKRSSSKIVITEVNWPLSNTAPYAPTSEKECVDTKTYAKYMLRYYLLALGTKKVESIFWHQLIAAGYGLIDNRDGKIVKREAYKVFKTMIKFLQNSEVINFSKSGKLYVLTCKRDDRIFDVIWSNEVEIELSEFHQVYNMYGEELEEKDIKISGEPIYAYHK